jgi:hypothetical protein
LHVAIKDLGVTAETDDALLNARTAGIVDPDHRRARAHGQIHHLTNLLGIHFTERTAEHREILREEEHVAPVDGRAAGDHAIAEKLFLFEPERRRTMHGETIEFRKRTGIDQRFNALARRALPALMLTFVRRFAGRCQRFRAHRLESLIGVIVRRFVPSRHIMPFAHIARIVIPSFVEGQLLSDDD